MGLRDTFNRAWRDRIVGADFRRTFGSPHGKRVLRNLMEENFAIQGTISIDEAGRVDPVGTAFNEGRRAAVLDILDTMRTVDQAEAVRELATEGDDYEFVETDG